MIPLKRMKILAMSRRTGKNTNSSMTLRSHTVLTGNTMMKRRTTMNRLS
ncbi:unnamed protein product [Dibothriocephalus latus]|uniref:Uncharacterized protein n=1 Tax=Dibothriocephalus latus TaxID=60516 RepID=A0A3P7PA67_DIBLA|nr:unnamed protein product [Dibothriocephalus latus]